MAPRSASTVAFASLVGSQLVQTAASAKGDPMVLAATAGSALTLIAVVQFPPTSFFFGCRPLGPTGWAISAAAAAGSSAAGGIVARGLGALSNT